MNRNFLRRNWTIGLATCVWAFALGTTSAAIAQEEKKIPEPMEVQLETSDKVSLSATYYPGTNEKETIPVILLHEWDKTDRKSMLNIAGQLQAQYGFAALIPDLRGHGKSNRTSTGDKLDRDRWRARELNQVMEDIEACKNFLIKENNEGKVNIDTLAVVAEGPTTIIAANWVIRDWSFPPLGSVKQGQDVKALVVLNPERNFKGLNGNDAWSNPLYTGRSGAAFPLMIGSERDHSRNAKNIFDRIKKGRRTLNTSDTALEKISFKIDQQRRVVTAKRNVQKSMGKVIGEFLKKQVYERRHDFRWATRGSN